MTTAQIDELERLEKAATAGPWVIGIDWGKDDWPSFRLRDMTEASEEEAAKDADFIAHARADIPKLLAEVKRLLEEFGNKQTECDNWGQLYKQVSGHWDTQVAEVKRLQSEKSALERTIESLRYEIENDGPAKQNRTAYLCAKTSLVMYEKRCAELRDILVRISSRNKDAYPGHSSEEARQGLAALSAATPADKEQGQ